MATNRSPANRSTAPATAQSGNAGRRWEAHSLTGDARARVARFFPDAEVAS